MYGNPLKRRRIEKSAEVAPTVSDVDPGNDHARQVESPDDVYSLINSKNWERAISKVKENPLVVSSCTKEPSMLALSCRLGAPYECVKEIIDAAPSKLRHLVDSRGTPLHEAIVCEEIGPEVIGYLLEIDERLGSDSRRAAVVQDVDGYTPLHLLIRMRFQSHVLADTNENETSHFIEILELLVRSCAEAIIIPDRREYEETPIVMAIKANVYAPMLQPEDTTTGRIERHIYDMVNCMLQHYPEAASRVFNGYRGHYTALHSAVFHGRCPDTIELLLNAEKKSPSNISQKACLLENTQGELPLHFCAMRGEPPRTVALLAKAAPEAISKRDAVGLTPVHWLWVRFVSTMLAIEDGRENSITVSVNTNTSQGGDNETQQFKFSSLEQDNFEADLHLLRRIDPTVDFLRMRHIPTEVQETSEALQWAERSATVLKGVRDRLAAVAGRRREDREDANDANDDNIVVLNRLEAITTLFWIKVVSLLKAVATHECSCQDDTDEDLLLVRTAFESGCCPPLVARIVALLYPEKVSIPDADGRLALHYSAMRPWHAWEWPREDGTSDSASSKLLNLESASLLRNAMSLSSVEAAKQTDKYGRLPIHYMISTCIDACCASGRSCSEDPLMEMLEILGFFIKLNPTSLSVCDPRSQLLPYLQASAESTKAINNNSNASSIHDELPLSIVYLLLRQDPSLIRPGSSPVERP